MNFKAHIYTSPIKYQYQHSENLHLERRFLLNLGHFRKYIRSFEMQFWRRMEIVWTYCEKKEEALQNVKEERNILHIMKRRKANRICHILRRNYLLKYVIERKIKERGRRGRRRKQILDDLMEKRGYWKLREEALDRTLWRTRFGRGYGPVVRQTTE
jgi:hypothetical protein